MKEEILIWIYEQGLTGHEFAAIIFLGVFFGFAIIYFTFKFAYWQMDRIHENAITECGLELDSKGILRKRDRS